MIYYVSKGRSVAFLSNTLCSLYAHPLYGEQDAAQSTTGLHMRWALNYNQLQADAFKLESLALPHLQAGNIGLLVM